MNEPCLAHSAPQVGLCPRPMAMWLPMLCGFLSHDVCEWALILSGQMVPSKASIEGNRWHKTNILGTVTG